MLMVTCGIVTTVGAAEMGHWLQKLAWSVDGTSISILTAAAEVIPGIVVSLVLPALVSLPIIAFVDAKLATKTAMRLANA